MPRAPKTYHLQAEMRRVADALFDLAEEHRKRDPALALSCYREARHLAHVAVQAVQLGVGDHAGQYIQGALANLQARLRIGKLTHALPPPNGEVSDVEIEDDRTD